MLTTGIRSEVGVKIYGSDLDTLEALARSVAERLRTVQGASNVYPEQVTNGQYLNITVDRDAAARYGLGVMDVQQVIENAIGETVLSTTIEGRQRFPVRVRYAPQFRADPQALGEVLVASAAGAQVPLGEVARIEHARGPAMISSENGLLLATVLLNVQDRDVGGFVEEARGVISRDVSLPAGYYVAWSGRWENQEHARQRLQTVLPVVLVVIFVLLYFTYHSALEAAHVLLAVPFALTGGIYLLWLLGYNFSVAVWVGFIALFGTAVQTGVVMVIYLEEAVERKRKELGVLTLSALREAVIEGALLRLRPKVMTVSTVVAGLLPIMWSTDVGAEVMKPLATPVLGGMVSSLIHVLIVTPVIFFTIRKRHLPLSQDELDSDSERWAWRRSSTVAATALVVVVLIGSLVWSARRAATTPSESTQANDVVHTVRSGEVEILLRAPGRVFRQGRNTFMVEFRSPQSHSLVDAGSVRASANMTMPGMVTSSGMQLQPSGTPGRYRGTADFGMAGAWQFAIDWDGPAGRGSASFEGKVQ
jgi:Cu(I)/Ag(I) efflux system membrane protein CusA/SilA